jgi:hypothetical protein
VSVDHDLGDLVTLQERNDRGEERSHGLLEHMTWNVHGIAFSPRATVREYGTSRGRVDTLCSVNPVGSQPEVLLEVQGCPLLIALPASIQHREPVVGQRHGRLSCYDTLQLRLSAIHISQDLVNGRDDKSKRPV